MNSFDRATDARWKGSERPGSERARSVEPRNDGPSELERVTRIELAFSAWEADVLPLNYTRGMAPEPSKSPGHGIIEPNSGLLVAGEFAVVTLA